MEGEYMPTLTTLGGTVITFNPSAIDAIADHNDSTGEAATCIYGIGASVLMTAESVQAFMQRLNIAASFTQLTRPDGRPVWLKGSSVSMLRGALAGEYAAAVQTVILAGSLTQGVREDPAQATAALNAHGGSL
jgi:hypothetical protein